MNMWWYCEEHFEILKVRGIKLSSIFLWSWKDDCVALQHFNGSKGYIFLMDGKIHCLTAG